MIGRLVLKYSILPTTYNISLDKVTSILYMNCVYMIGHLVLKDS